MLLKMYASEQDKRRKWRRNRVRSRNAPPFFERMEKRASHLAAIFSDFAVLRLRIRFKFTTKLDTPA